MALEDKKSTKLALLDWCEAQNWPKLADEIEVVRADLLKHEAAIFAQKENQELEQ